MRIKVKNKVALFSLMTSFIVILSGCSLPYGYKGKSKSFNLTQDRSAHAQQSIGQEFSAYQINPGDVLELIYRHEVTLEDSYILNPLDTIVVNFLAIPNWNSQQRIRPNGTISLPYFPEIKISGLTVPEATQFVQQKYKSILKDPKIYLMVSEFQSKQERIRASLLNPSTGSSRLVTVQTDGYVSLPLIGMVRAGALPFIKFREQIYDKYFYDYGLQVDLVLSKAAGKQIYVVGMLNQPGVYEMPTQLNTLQAISLARGFREDAQLKQVMLVRRVGDIMNCISLDITATLEGRGTDGLVNVQNGDIIYVPRTRLASAAEVATQISAISFFRGISTSVSWQMRDRDGDVIFF